MGLSSNNYYVAERVTYYKASGNTANITANNGYGVGYVLSNDVEAGKSYLVDFSVTNTASVIASYYDSEGNYLASSAPLADSNGVFTVPSGVEYIVLVMTPSTSTTFTLNSITQI